MIFAARTARTAWQTAVLAFVVGSGFACSSRDLHPNFKNEGEVLRREWAYSISPSSSSLPLSQAEYSSPVVLDNTLLFGSNRFGVVSLYPKIERPRWKIQIENGIVSDITIDKEFGYFTGGDGNMYAISLDTGKTLWTYALRNPVTSQPTIDGNDLFVTTSDDALVSLEATTGKWQWHYRRRNVSGPVIHGASKPLVVGDTLWVGFADGSLVCVSRKDGKVIWEKQLNSNKRFASINAELTMVDGIVYVPAYDNALYAMDAKTGGTVWIKDNLGGSRKVTVADGVLYAPTSTGYVYAMDAKNGKDLWHFEIDQGVPTNVIVGAKHVIFASSFEHIYALTKDTGRLVYRYQVGFGSGFAGNLAFDAPHSMLYALSQGGNLYSFKYLPEGH